MSEELKGTIAECCRSVAPNRKCYFIGHRDAREDIRQLLHDTIHKHIIEYGVTEFYVGSHGRFDSMTAGALVEMKKKHPHIMIYVVLAYHPALRKVNIPDGFDGSYFPEGQERSSMRYAIPRLNRRMVREADYLIAYVWKITDGSYNLMHYARTQEKKGQLTITNLAKLQSETDMV